MRFVYVNNCFKPPFFRNKSYRGSHQAINYGSAERNLYNRYYVL